LSPASICSISARASLSGSTQSHFGGNQPAGQVFTPALVVVRWIENAYENRGVHPARPHLAAQLPDNHGVLVGFDLATELQQGQARVRIVGLEHVVRQIGVRHPQRH
jgi:hypothetical protein